MSAAVDRGIVEAFESATGVDIPDQIAGVSVPNPECGGFFDTVVDFVDNVSELDDIVEKAGKVREVLAKGLSQASNCWVTLESTREVVDSIQTRAGPVAPLLSMDASAIPEALGMFNKETLDTCVAIVGDVLDLGKLLKKISSFIDIVRKAFRAVQDFCGDIIDKLMEYVPDLVQTFADALGFGGALDGVTDLLSGIASIVAELCDISGVLRPILTRWEDSNWFEACAFAATNFTETSQALQRFWPAWEESKVQYAAARDMGEEMTGGSSQAWYTYKPMFNKLCDVFGCDVPGGDDALDELAKPSI